MSGGAQLNSSTLLQISEPLTESSISVRLTSQESGLGRSMASLAGQMGCIYLFEDTLSPGKSVQGYMLFPTLL